MAEYNQFPRSLFVAWGGAVDNFFWVEWHGFQGGWEGDGGVVIRRRQLLKGELLDMDCLLTANEEDHKYITET